MKLTVIALLLLAGIGAYAADEPGRLYAGTAKTDITPAEADATDLINNKVTI